MKKLFAYGGIAASVILIAFGIGAIVVGVTGLNTVRDEIARRRSPRLRMQRRSPAAS